MHRQSLPFSPPTILTIGFLMIIFLGCLLLKLPFATHQPITWMQALFTATSAVTVTGLAVVDTAQFTYTGQLFIAGMIQIGGLGFMTFAVLAFASLQRRLNMNSQLVALEALGETNFGSIISTAKAVLTIALIIESMGIIILTGLFWQLMPFNEALYHGFFYSISAFNNAGFALTSQSLTPYAKHDAITFIVSLLVIIGGLGFLVIKDIHEHKCWRKFGLNTKLVLTATLIINIIAFLLFWLLEHNNPKTLGNMSIIHQLSSAWFAVISPRTAGFNTLPVESLTDSATLLTIFLMFIGGGSLSTASGLKIGTFLVLTLTTLTFLRQQTQVSAFGRTIPERSVRKALALASITGMLLFFGVFILSMVEHQHDFLDVLFEAVSALGTVGLSRGLTTQLSGLGEWIIMLMMFVGRIGPLTLAYLIATPKVRRIRYPEENVLIG